MEYQVTPESEVRLSEQAIAVLKETAKWAYFLAILGFVGIALLVVVSFFIGSLYSTMSSMSGSPNPIAQIGSGVLTAIYLLFALLYFFPVYYLYKFASTTKLALQSRNPDMLANGLTYLKSHYKFIGIMFLVILSIYVLIFIFAIIGFAFAA